MKQTNNQAIIIKGAREHNLANITAKIPKNKLVVFAGVSGSGKTSLAMDTLYAEGQRRYLESLSSYGRQFLGTMKRPKVDTIEGLSPAIAIDQKALSHNPRSTVGTVTEIYDYLRVLFARLGHPHCPNCGREVARQTSVSITEQMLKVVANQVKEKQVARFFILSPLIRDKRGEFTALFQNLRRKGFEQVRVDGHLYPLDQELVLIKTNRHNIEVVVDKLNLVKKFSFKNYHQRLLDDNEIALELADGLVILTEVNDPSFNFPKNPRQMKDHLFSQRLACPVCNLSLNELEPRFFSFNAPQGACPKCQGLGVKLRIDRSRTSAWRAEMLEKQYFKTTSDTIRQEIEKLMIRETCQACLGKRLRPEALSVTINQDSIDQLASLSLKSLWQWTKNLPAQLSSNKEKEICQPLLKEINNRLSFLIAVGVDYLSLARPASTLSVGEAQRIRLASQVGSSLTGICYVLDEPTVGLHQRDTQRLITTLKKLRNLGNTVIVVEHDQEVLTSADWIIDFGPGAGKKGGRLIATGTPDQIKKNRASLTGQYLAGKKQVPQKNQSLTKPDGWLTLTGCSLHNLKKITFSFPLKQFICITGVSGSGKSTLIQQTLYPAIKLALDPSFKEKPGPYEQIDGAYLINQVLVVDQSPIGKTSRSNPATYTGVFTDIRQLFAQTKEARLKGLSKSHFSFNLPGGRCEACKGQGIIRIEMQFIPDVWVTCEECQGTRFKNEVLEVEYRQKNIHQILQLTIEEGLKFFAPFPQIIKKLKVFEKIGLDYLQLGQPSPTLSGGESQRLKLARELVKTSKGQTLYLLDEPTVGLHFADIEKVLEVIEELVFMGNTVIVIEHNLEVIKNADFIVDLGPEGGEAGGKIVATGTPFEVAKNSRSWTGRYLKRYFKKQQQ